MGQLNAVFLDLPRGHDPCFVGAQQPPRVLRHQRNFGGRLRLTEIYPRSLKEAQGSVRENFSGTLPSFAWISIILRRIRSINSVFYFLADQAFKQGTYSISQTIHGSASPPVSVCVCCVLVCVHVCVVVESIQDTRRHISNLAVLKDELKNSTVYSCTMEYNKM